MKFFRKSLGSLILIVGTLAVLAYLAMFVVILFGMGFRLPDPISNLLDTTYPIIFWLLFIGGALFIAIGLRRRRKEAKDKSLPRN